MLAALQSGIAAAGRSWHDGIPVQLAGSHIELISVTSDVASDQMFLNGRVQQGPLYFNDCLTWVDRADVAVTHAQFIYATVTTEGEIKHKPLPLDIHYRAQPGEKRDDRNNCRDHAYANGADGLWLVAWVNEVDFADGTSWRAAPIDQMQSYIIEALPRQ